jgi:hypothetical protein
MKHRRHVFTISVALAALALLPACRDAVAPRDPATGAAALTRETAPLFQTGSLSYTLVAGSHGYEGEIDVRFTNRTAGTVFFVNCSGATSLSLEKRILGAWVAVWTPVLQHCLSQPITVPPGGTYDSRIGVFGGYPGSNAWPQFVVTNVAGSYRLVWHDALRSYQDRLPFGVPLALEHRVSNRFELQSQPR